MSLTAKVAPATSVLMLHQGSSSMFAPGRFFKINKIMKPGVVVHSSFMVRVCPDSLKQKHTNTQTNTSGKFLVGM
jgi:hypothetical protein